jgi:hypothetical protein
MERLETFLGAFLDFLLQPGVAEGASDEVTLEPIGSFDPNDKIGVGNGGEAHFLSGRQPLQYSVRFENRRTATAPAREVLITDQLDMLKVDPGTVSLGPISFGRHTVTPPAGRISFTAEVDLRPAMNLIVRVIAGLNPATGLLSWRLTSLDPVTRNPPADPRLGFLPPNVNPPEGDGAVLFSVMPKVGFLTGSEIRNRASIVFDANAPIVTPEWLNTIDATAPVSRVLALSPTQTAPAFPVRWSAADQGAGVGTYTVFVSDNNGPFIVWQNQTRSTQATFPGANGHTYHFYSIARDLVGNVESEKTTAEATTTVVVTNVSGDVNGDGVVNCTDIAIVRAAFGTKTGQPRWDARADVVTDGVIDVRDLAFVSQRLPVGTRCQ